jgi:CysZ protein
MLFFRNLYIALRAYYKAVLFIREHKLYWFILIPAALMPVIYKLGDLIRTHQVTISDESMTDIVWSMIRMMLEITAGLTLMKFSKYLVVMLLSPLFSFLSMKCERIMTGNTYPFDLTQFINDIKRGLRIAIRNILWHYFFFFLIFIVAWAGWEHPEKSPVFYLSFIIGFFYYGFSFLDYVNERLRMNLSESIQFIRSHRGLAIGIGMIYSLMILVPVDLEVIFTGKVFRDGFLSGTAQYLLQLLLWLCAASAPIFAIVAATISMHDVINLKSAGKRSAGKQEANSI